MTNRTPPHFTALGVSPDSWRPWPDQDPLTFRGELHGSLIPFFTNGIMVACIRVRDDLQLLIHVSNIEETPVVREVKRREPAREDRQARPKDKLSPTQLQTLSHFT